MKRGIPGKSLPETDTTEGGAESIDLRYGLEPVIDPSSSTDDDAATGGLQFQRVCCPYCGEGFEVQLDLSAGSSRYVEDCHICCQPIELSLEVDYSGTLQSLTIMRGD